jgi:hypothetical protein
MVHALADGVNIFAFCRHKAVATDSFFYASAGGELDKTGEQLLQTSAFLL